MLQPSTKPHLLARAAVRGSFDPLTLLDHDASTFEAETAYLAERSTETRVGERWLWMLNSASRIEGLAKLPADAKERARFLEANPPQASDAFGRMLHRALGVRGPTVTAGFVAKLSVDEQVALFQVIEALLGAGIPVPEWVSAETARRIRRSIAVRDREEAARVVVQHKFQGRVRERKLLCDFAERGGQMIEALRGRKIPSVTLNKEMAFSGAIPALAITGIGGIGKSALLTTIARTVAERPDTTVLVFDFDRPDLRAGDTTALTMELSRQLALLEPDLDAIFSDCRRKLRQALASITSTGRYERTQSAVLATFSEWATNFAGRPRLEWPLILLMDTFEEVLLGQEARLHTLAEWAIKLRNHVGFANIRIMFFGRAIEIIENLPPSYIHVGATVQLGDLGLRAGTAHLAAMLQGRHTDLVQPLAITFGTNPLVLDILARYALDRPRAEIVELIEEGKRGVGRSLKGEFAQRFLYSRILGRLQGNDVTVLAHPGLVLRRVDATLVREVLADACGLGQVSDGRAEELLATLKKQTWLVERNTGDDVVHRRDVRGLMLEQMLGEDPRQANKALLVARKASEWYRNRNASEEDRLEALYYAALAGDPIPEEKKALRALADHLGPYVEDLPLRIRALTKDAAGGRRLSQMELDALPVENRRRILGRRRRRLVSEGLESAVREAATPAPVEIESRDILRAAAEQGIISHQIEGRLPPPWEGEREIEDEPLTNPLYNFRVEQDPELIQSRFKNAEFDAIAAEALPLFGRVLRNLVQDQPPDRVDVLNHPAYLAAIAARETSRTDPVRFLMTQIGNLARTNEPLADAVRREIREALAGRGDVAVALLSLVMAGIDPRELPGIVGRAVLPGAPPARETASWRVEMALRTVRGPSPPAACAVLFPVLAKPLIDIILDEKRHANLEGPVRFEAGDRRERLVEAIGQVLSKKEVTLSDLNTSDQEARLAVFVIRWPALSPEMRPLMMVGRSEEFYGAVRTCVLKFENMEVFASGIESLKSEAAVWPSELQPSAFLRPHALQSLVPALVDVADRCGLLGRLIEVMMSLRGAPKELKILNSAYRKFIEAWIALEGRGLRNSDSA